MFHALPPTGPYNSEGATHIRTVDVKGVIGLGQGDCPQTLFHQLKRTGLRSNWNLCALTLLAHPRRVKVCGIVLQMPIAQHLGWHPGPPSPSLTPFSLNSHCSGGSCVVLGHTVSFTVKLTGFGVFGFSSWPEERVGRPGLGSSLSSLICHPDSPSR